MNDVSLSPWEPGEREPSAFLKPVFTVVEGLFRFGVRMRTLLFDIGLMRSRRAECCVISVGNLAVGGIGKTPFVVLLARQLASRGRRVAVLSRGYGARASRAEPLIVSCGEGPPLASADQAGDEPLLIAQKTNARVVVGKRRIDAAHVAVRELDADVIILDDGFQHRALVRDLDIVLLDAAAPFGNGRLLPLGPLREPPGALERAGLIVSIGTERKRSVLYVPTRPSITVQVEASSFAPIVGGESEPASRIAHKRVALLAAIARPRRFEETVLELGAEIVHRSYHRDHAWIGRSTIDAFERDARAKGAELLLTTEKDAVRIPREYSGSVRVLAIEHRVIEGAEVLERALDEVLR